jgi:hypothetical protein
MGLPTVSPLDEDEEHEKGITRGLLSPVLGFLGRAESRCHRGKHFQPAGQA